jgi:hypothetical protein
MQRGLARNICKEDHITDNIDIGGDIYEKRDFDGRVK